MKCLWLLLSGYLLVDLCYAEEEVELRYACWGSAGPPVVSAQCPVGTVIQILRSGLKVKRVRSYQCQYSDEDCGCSVGDEACNMPDTMALCMGRSQCRLDVMQQYINTDSCRGFSDYMFVEFKCVRVNGQVQDICQSTMAERSVGFIQSPDYPSVYSSNTLCTCNLTSESTVSLSMLDVAMSDENGECTDDRVTIVANGQRYNHCGRKRPSTAQAIAKSINIEFETNNKNVSNGFWLKYQAVKQRAMITIACRSIFKPPPSTTTTTTTTTTPPTTTTTASSTTTEQSIDKPIPALNRTTHRLKPYFKKDVDVDLDKVKEDSESNVNDRIDGHDEYEITIPDFNPKIPSRPNQRWSSFSYPLPNGRTKPNVLPPNVYAKRVNEKPLNAHTNPFTSPYPKFHPEILPREFIGKKYKPPYNNPNPDRHTFSTPRRKPQQPSVHQSRPENHDTPPLPYPLASPIAVDPHFDNDLNGNEECMYVALRGGMVTIRCKPISRPPQRPKPTPRIPKPKSKQSKENELKSGEMKPRKEDISRTKWHTKSYEETEEDDEGYDDNEDQGNVINNETEVPQSEIDENKDEINEVELKEELTNEIEEIDDRQANKKSRNYDGESEQDLITGKQPGENKQESLTGSEQKKHKDNTQQLWSNNPNVQAHSNDRTGHTWAWKTERTTIPPFYPRNWIDINSESSRKHGAGGMGFGPNGNGSKDKHSTPSLHNTWLKKPTNKYTPTKAMHALFKLSPKGTKRLRSKSKSKMLNDVNVKRGKGNPLKVKTRKKTRVHMVRPNHPDMTNSRPSNERNNSVIIGEGTTTVKPNTKSTLELMFGDRVTIIAASVIGSILMIVVLGIIIRFVVNRADPNQQVRRNHKKECVIHKHPQNNMA